MKNKGFTLIELLTVIAITSLLIAIVYSVINGANGGQINALIHPRAAQAQAQQELVEEMREQNRLLREQMNRNKEVEK